MILLCCFLCITFQRRKICYLLHIFFYVLLKRKINKHLNAIVTSNVSLPLHQHNKYNCHTKYCTNTISLFLVRQIQKQILSILRIDIFSREIPRNLKQKLTNDNFSDKLDNYHISLVVWDFPVFLLRKYRFRVLIKEFVIKINKYNNIYIAFYMIITFFMLM